MPPVSNSLQDVQGAHVIDAQSIGGEIEAVEQVELAPKGVVPINAEWKGGIAILPTR